MPRRKGAKAVRADLLPLFDEVATDRADAKRPAPDPPDDSPPAKRADGADRALTGR